jgi:MFS family permease
LSQKSAVERLVLVVSAAVFIDTMFYAVISPLLPDLSHQLGLSKLSAGVMTASYPAGMLVGSFPGGVLAVRRGPRFTVCVGLLMLVASTVAFGWLDSAPALDVARFAEGFGGACSWAGGIAWLVAATPVERRGAVIGKALAMAIGGSLFGPAIGAIASAIGRGPLFTVLAMSGLILTLFVRTVPDQTESSQQSVTVVIKMMGRPAMVRGLWLMALPAVVSGTLNVLAPLQIHRFGGGAAVIGATFLVGAGLEAIVSPWVGHLSDRHGRLLPLRLGLVGTAVTLGCFTLPTTTLELSMLVILVCIVLGAFWAPAMALLSDVSERYGIDQAHAAALMNLAWAAGQIVGAAGGGATAKAFGDSFPAVVTAGVCVLSIAATRRSTVPDRG